MKKTLLLAVHPNLDNDTIQGQYQKSFTNSRLIEAVEDLEHVRVHKLYQLYPDFNINVAQEQALLLEHERIILLSPFYWYSTTPLAKKWMDDVLEYGFAYGSNGDKLAGKEFAVWLTTGGPAASYTSDGYNKYTLETFLKPIERTVELCKMQWLPFQALSSVANISGLAMSDEKLAHIEAFAKQFRHFLNQNEQT